MRVSPGIPPRVNSAIPSEATQGFFFSEAPLNFFPKIILGAPLEVYSNVAL